MKTLQVVNTNTLETHQILIDDYAYEFLKDRKLGVYGDTNRRPYVRVSIEGSWIPLHKLLSPMNGAIVDHKNGNQFDNRLENLRIATTEENNYNRSKAYRPGKPYTSIYKGVSRTTDGKKWRAAVKKNKVYYLGRFEKEDDAARAYDAKARELFGEYAKLNFPVIR